MRERQHRRAGFVAVGIGAALFLTGCGGGSGATDDATDAPTPTMTDAATSSPPEESDEPTGSAEPTESPEPEESTEPTDEPEDPFEGDTALSTSDPGDGAMLTVTDVRVGAHADYDRVVFDLEGEGTPGWRVEYVDEALEPGRGSEVEVAGDAVLQVILTGTAMPMDSGVTEYGGDPVPGPGDAIEEVVYRFVFEGQTTAFVGVDGEQRPFRVFSLEDPTRVVVDVAH